MNIHEDQSLVVYVVEVLSQNLWNPSNNVVNTFGLKIKLFFLPPFKGGHTRRVCPEGVKRPRRVPVEKETSRTK